MRTVIAAVLVFAVCAPTALAKKWTDSTGTYSVEAEFVDFQDGRVRLRKSDGKTLTIPIERLSHADQEWVKAQGDAVVTAPEAVRAADRPVVGVRECRLFATPDLEEEAGALPAGTEIVVEEEGASAVRVATAEGKKGWVRRCCLCTASEFDRRKKDGEVPENLICIGADENGTFFYGGAMPIKMGQFALEAGQAFWMDESARGRTFTVASHPLRGDPGVVFLYTKEDKVAKLPIWIKAANTTGTATKPRDGSDGTTPGLAQPGGMEPRAIAPRPPAAVQDLTGRSATLRSREAGRASSSGQELFDLLIQMIDARGATTIWLRSENDEDAVETTLQLGKRDLEALRAQILAAKFYGPLVTRDAVVWQLLGDVPIGQGCAPMTKAGEILGLKPGEKVNMSLTTDNRCLISRTSSTEVHYFDRSAIRADRK